MCPALIRGVSVLLLLLCVMAPASAQSGMPTSGTVAGGDEDFAGLVEIGGGRRMWLACRGSGAPVVILEAGSGNDADNWDTAGLPPGSAQTAVLPGVAQFTRVCAYDRPGTVGRDLEQRGRSDPAPMPRTAAEMVADLNAMLRAADVPGPYVLAGHSFGGLVARLYAATYPDDVVGLVLIDAAHEDYYDQQRAVLTPEQWAAISGSATAEAFPGQERIDTDASAAKMRRAATDAPLRPMPLVVVTHGRPWDWPPDFPAADLEAIWLPLQEHLAALAPDGRLVVAEESGHFIPGDQPEVVVAAIRQVVEAVRDPATWATPESADESASQKSCWHAGSG